MVATPAASGSALRSARAVADAVLYEGYLLYPYRRSSGKNVVRWQFGVLFPPGWARAHGLDDTGVAGSAESWWQQTECLAEAPPSAEAEICVRFLQVQQRSVEERLADGTYRPAGELTIGGQAELTFDEAVPQEFTARLRLADLLAGERRLDLHAPAGRQVTQLQEGDGAGPADVAGSAGGTGPAGETGPPDGTGQADGTGHAGRVVRQRLPVTATATIAATACQAPPGLVKLRVRIANTGALPPEAPRAEALRVSLVACHVLLAMRGGEFVSLLDPPEAARDAARACRNVHTFPVLAGPPGQREVVLSSPIILYDHPQIAPESPGDLHDATEIDEILSLRALTLTEAEKREARATDRRAAAILDRLGAMPDAVFARLHGTIRQPPREDGPALPDAGPALPGDGPAAPTAGQRPELPWWDPGADTSVSPETDSVLVAGVRLARGSLVRLRPRRHGTDPQDMFLDGRAGRVEAVLLDVDGAQQLAVTIEDDPGAELNRWYGRYRYFRPDEVEPLPTPGEPG